jgi:hypothetical protein
MRTGQNNAHDDIPVLCKYSLVVHFENDGAQDLVEVIVLYCRDAIDGAAANEHQEESRVLKGSDHHGEARGRGQSRWKDMSRQ